MRFRVVLPVLILLPMLGFCQAKKSKKSVPAVFGNARYVYVEAEDGDVFQPDLLPDDRQAIMDVEDEMRDWGRYVLTATASEAELVFFVRKGRVVTTRAGVSVGVGGPGTPHTRSVGANGGAEVGPPDDLLEVKMRNPDGGLSSPIWLHSQKDGLEPPNVALFRALREAVDHDYPQ